MESANQLVTISKLFGLMTCVSLAFIFPLFAYETNSTVMFTIMNVQLDGLNFTKTRTYPDKECSHCKQGLGRYE